MCMEGYGLVLFTVCLHFPSPSAKGGLRELEGFYLYSQNIAEEPEM